MARDFLNIGKRTGAMSSASSFNTRGPRLSGPGDLFGFSSLSSFLMPFSVMLVCYISGKSSSE